MKNTNVNVIMALLDPIAISNWVSVSTRSTHMLPWSRGTLTPKAIWLWLWPRLEGNNNPKCSKRELSTGVIAYYGDNSYFSAELFDGRVKVAFYVGNYPPSFMYSYVTGNPTLLIESRNFSQWWSTSFDSDPYKRKSDLDARRQSIAPDRYELRKSYRIRNRNETELVSRWHTPSNKQESIGGISFETDS